MSRRKTKPAKVRFIGTSEQMANFEQQNQRFISDRSKVQINDDTGLGRRYYRMVIGKNSLQ